MLQREAAIKDRLITDLAAHRDILHLIASEGNCPVPTEIRQRKFDQEVLAGSAHSVVDGHLTVDAMELTIETSDSGGYSSSRYRSSAPFTIQFGPLQ